MYTLTNICAIRWKCIVVNVAVIVNFTIREHSDTHLSPIRRHTSNSPTLNLLAPELFF